ncbi:MAG: AAA family ATPase [Kiritimatiellaeota bacterium]|nr:AAA family ATPase [Kiritimatiellota bacterium]
MSRIIEFMGLPGAGKSTLARVLLAELRQRGLSMRSNEEAVIHCVRRRDDGILMNVIKRLPFGVWEPIAGSRYALLEFQLFSSAHTPLLGLVFEILNRDPVPPALQQCILYALYLHYAERQLLETHLGEGESVVVEEGVAMGLLALLGSLPPGKPCEEDIERYARDMPASFGVVWVDADPAICAARLRRRPQLPLPWAACSDEALLAHLEYGRHILDRAAAEFRRRGTPVCRIPNSEAAVGCAVELVRAQGREWADKLLRC